MSITSSFARRRDGRLVAHHRTLSPVVHRWARDVIAADGTYSDQSVVIADRFERAILDSGFYGKIIYSLLFLGAGDARLRAAGAAFHNTLSVGTPTNIGPFANGDHSEATGLNSSGGKYFNTLIKASQVGAGGNGGIAYWELSPDFSGATTEVAGSYDNSGGTRFVLDLRSTRKFFSWSNAGNAANINTAAVAGFYYGQRSSATLRELFVDGVSVATNTTSDAASGAGDRNIILMGANAPLLLTSKGRCGFFALTDGTLSSGNVADFDYIVRTFLMKPTRRIT